MDQTPKFDKKRAQKPAEGQFPSDTAQKQTGGIADADVCVTDSKAVIQPHPKGNHGENKICQMGQSGAQGTEKSVKQPQAAAQQTGDDEAMKGKGWGNHRNNRCQKPPLGRGSS